MKKNISYLILGLLSFFSMSMSQEAYANGERDSIPESAYSNGFPYPFALGVHLGTTGFGLHVYQPLSSKFGARLGVSYMPFNTKISGTYGNKDVNSDVSAKSGNASLTFGWTPFVEKGGFFRSFNLQIGGAYFFKLDGKISSHLADPYKYGDIAVDPLQVGSITSNLQWKKTVNPYAGIGWSNIIIDSRVSMHIDLGCYYLSKPKVSMEATGLLEENVNNAATIERNIENYRYLPRLEFGFSYRFWK